MFDNVYVEQNEITLGDIFLTWDANVKFIYTNENRFTQHETTRWWAGWVFSEVYNNETEYMYLFLHWEAAKEH